MLLIIGLGNPQKKYEKNRHNTGFIAIDELRRIWNFPEWIFNKKFNAEISEGSINNEKIILGKPQTFMNFSGTSVKKITYFYKISAENIIVIHDDLDIEFGKYKVSSNSSAAGHKGVQSIINDLGTQEFKRIRVGIEGEEKRKERKIPGDEFVLQNFSDGELKIIRVTAKKLGREIF